MEKFRYYIDLGSGYVLIDVYKNNLSLKVDKSDSLIFEAKNLSGSISFLGQTAVDCFDNRTILYYVPFKIEEYNGSAWNTLLECEADIRGEYLRLSKVMTISKFQQTATENTSILAALKTPYKLAGLVQNRQISQTITSTRLDVYSIPTSLTPGAYTLSYTLEGYAVTLEVDVRWANFRYYSTTGVSPNLIHRYSIQSFDYLPGYDEGWNLYFKMLFDGDTYWAKSAVPPVTYAEETFASVLLQRPHRLDDVLYLLINGIDSGLTFDNTDSGDLFDATQYYIGYTDECNLAEVKGLDFTLETLFKFLLEFYNLGWYIEGTKLKFRERPYIYYNSTLDWSVETVNWDSVKMAYNPIPDREKWEFADKTLDRHYISYFDKGVKTDDLVNNYISPFAHDFFVLKQQSAPSGMHIWIQWDGSTVTVRDPKYLFDLTKGSSAHLFSEYDPWYIKIDPSQSFVNLPPDVYFTRPIYSVKHKKWIDDYSAFDLFSKIDIDGDTVNNEGYLNSYVIDLNSGVAEFDLWFKKLYI